MSLMKENVKKARNVIRMGLNIFFKKHSLFSNELSQVRSLGLTVKGFKSLSYMNKKAVVFI